MAVVTVKSTVITNRDAVPAVINDGRLERGSLRSSHGYVTATNGDSANSKYVLASVPSSAMVRQILFSCANLGASSAINLGVSRNTKDGGAAVSASLFASAQATSAALSNSDVTNQSGSFTLDKQEQPLWQAAGMAADPGGTLDIVATVSVAIAATGLLGANVEYVDNGN
ncbi:hypothetical protein ACUXAV_000390 [Cupriavidus metallidurans]|uniref:hypothetical protein n=1 Tax=Cupriavidus metallidurans TaxID=119219 RepID=UPI0004936B3F|nr:hypothetical protein [Cupriavidus metallidurans]MDE4918350.1 hypothetical protein [Cupriavidus metallidurans]